MLTVIADDISAWCGLLFFKMPTPLHVQTFYTVAFLDVIFTFLHVIIAIRYAIYVYCENKANNIFQIFCAVYPG